MSFKTLGVPPTIESESESASEVKSSSATLSAEIDPGGEDTAYRVEYVSEAQFDAYSYAEAIDAPQPEGDAGSGHSSVTASVHVQELQPSTTYHYRFVIGNAIHRGVQGLDRTFTTQPSGTEFELPDGRAWEQVSPTNKHGAGIYPISAEKVGGPIQAAEAGGAITYIANGPFEPEPQGSRAFEFTQVLSTRGPEGWESKDIDTPHTSEAPYAPGWLAEYKLFSNDLSLGLVESKGETPLPPLGEGAEKTIYLRHDTECEPTPAVAIPPTCYQALVTATNVPKGAKIGRESPTNEEIKFVGASPNLSHVVFTSPEALTSNSVRAAGLVSLYEWGGRATATGQCAAWLGRTLHSLGRHKRGTRWRF